MKRASMCIGVLLLFPGCGEERAVAPVMVGEARTAELPPPAPPEPPPDVEAPAFPEDAVLLASASGRLDATAREVTLHWPAAADAVGVVAYVLRVDGEEAARVDALAEELPGEDGIVGIVQDRTAEERGATERGRLEGVTFEAARTFAVVAVDGAGNESAPLETRDALAPFWPEGTEVDAQTDNGTATFTWPAASDDVGVVRYSIQRGEEELASLGRAARRYRLELAEGESRDIVVIAQDAAGHKTRLRVNWSRAAVLAAQAQVEQMLLGALGDHGAFADVLRSGAVSGDSEDVLARAEGVGIASSGGTLRERGGGGGLAMERSGGGLGALRAGAGSSTESLGGTGVVEHVARGRVELGPPEESGSGTFDGTTVTRMIRIRLSAMRACYERELRNDPTLAGRVRFEMTVNPPGTVTGVSTIENTTGSEPVAACVTRVVSRLRFNPGPESGSVTYRYPVTLALAQ